MGDGSEAATHRHALHQAHVEADFVPFDDLRTRGRRGRIGTHAGAVVGCAVLGAGGYEPCPRSGKTAGPPAHEAQRCGGEPLRRAPCAVCVGASAGAGAARLRLPVLRRLENCERGRGREPRAEGRRARRQGDGRWAEARGALRLLSVSRILVFEPA